jgi:DNA (cytosine-5)-methyltransferase 1
MVMRLLDLFSGIGGFSYAAEKLVGGYETVAFCEQDEFCQKVLRKHWKDVPIYDDVRTIDAARLGRIDIVAGGFPCQAVSQAGLQKATEDDRWLWDEMLRIIQGCKPRWVIGENVVGLININEGVLFEQVQTDLEKEGYSVQSVVIPACAKNAPHRRDRVWIVGYSNATNTKRMGWEQRSKIREASEREGWSNKFSNSSSTVRERKDVANTKRKSINNTDSRWNDRLEKEKQKTRATNGSSSGQDVSNSNSHRSKTRLSGQDKGKIGDTEKSINRDNRQRGWETIHDRATQCKMGYLDDGISRGLLRHFDREPEHIPRVTTGEKDRAKKLRSLGNSIVPQVAAEIFNAIKVAEHGKQ